MKMIIFLVLVFAACAVGGYLLHLCKKSPRYDTSRSSLEMETTEFCVADYLDRIENAAIRLWEEQEPLDTTITLWWGLEGLKKSENGKLEWVNRARKESLESVTYPNKVTGEIPAYWWVVSNGCFDISWDHEIIGNTYRVSVDPTIQLASRMCENNIARSFAGMENAMNSQISALQMAQSQINQNIISQLNQNRISQCCCDPGYMKVDIS